MNTIWICINHSCN